MNVRQYKLTLVSMLVLLLSSCATHKQEDPLNKNMLDRVQHINQQLPVQQAGVTLVRADKGDNHSIILQLYQSQKREDGNQVLQLYAKALCKNQETHYWIVHGGGYNLKMITADKQMLNRYVKQC